MNQIAHKTVMSDDDIL